MNVKNNNKHITKECTKSIENSLRSQSFPL